MEYQYDIDEIKTKLSIVQVKDLCAELGGEPQMQDDYLICKTICHGGQSHKLYYYDNTKLFRCTGECRTRAPKTRRTWPTLYTRLHPEATFPLCLRNCRCKPRCLFHR